MKKVYEIALQFTRNHCILSPPTRTHDMKTDIKSIKTVSEYIANGGLKIGFLLESPIGETAKALAFKTVKYNSYANPYESKSWLPKSQLIKVVNDYYVNITAKEMYFCPTWLYVKNFSDGESLASA